MRDFASCFSEYALQVSDTTSCSSYSNSSCISPSNNLITIPSIQNAVTCLYKTTLSSQKQILITLTWCRNTTLSITLGDDPNTALKLTTNSTRSLFRKLKGTKTVDFLGTHVEVIWDLSSACYESGPEPVSDYYVVVSVDSEVGPIIGDMGHEVAMRRIKSGSARTAKSTAMISRREHFSGGGAVYSTRARFSEAATWHQIVIQCGGGGGGRSPVMSVCIDKKPVIRVKRLQWNFRGNQTIFLDGLLVDLMWDVHDWFYNSGTGYAVFMFRTRNGLDSRLWMEEKMVKKEEEDEDIIEFSLMIYACKNYI